MYNSRRRRCRDNGAANTNGSSQEKIFCVRI